MLIDPRSAVKINNLETVETKSVGSAALSSFTEFLWRGGNGDLSAFMAIQLYEKAMPFFNAVDMRSTAFSQIPVRLWDSKKEEFIDEHPVLDLLYQPNADISQVEFLEQLASFYDITGNNFVVATGHISKEPLELITVAPQFVNFGFGGSKGLLNIPDQIKLNIFNNRDGQVNFKADENAKLGLRFVNSREDQEIWHTRSFNPKRSGSNFWGMSRARPVWLELEQYVSGNTTNLSMLKRGTRMSLAWVNNRGEELTETQFQRLQEEAQKYAGDANAGGTPILDGMDVKSIQQTNKDMEFKDLQEAMLSRVSTVYGVPLPLLLADSMTLNNLETSMLQFFDRAVLPLANRLYNELSRFLLPRYKDTENLELKYNESDISAVRSRMIKTAKEQSEVGVNTDNELRAILGYESLEQGGDEIWKPMGSVPIGMDDYTDDNLKKPKVKQNFIQKLEERGWDKKSIADAVSKHWPDGDG